jgi:hypothetical protein
LIPKFLVNADGSLGARNDIYPSGVEHKLGMHASPTCTMTMGDQGGAIGYLIGEENRGMLCMFTMMNQARLGVGLEGYALAAENRIGQASGNLIFRYPFPDSRFAPYAFAGGGVIFNGSKTEDLVERGLNLGTITNNSNAKGIGQFGGGIEVRVTPHIGIMNDFSWNVINGSNNNFGMVRTGIRFAF